MKILISKAILASLIITGLGISPVPAYAGEQQGGFLYEKTYKGFVRYKDPRTQRMFTLASQSDAIWLLRASAVGITTKNLETYPIALFNTAVGVDTDTDGLSDAFEMTIGTSPYAWDTDGDGIHDKQEIARASHPKGKGVLKKPRNPHLGTLFIQADKSGEAWYIHPLDGRRYFLGAGGQMMTSFKRIVFGPSFVEPISPVVSTPVSPTPPVTAPAVILKPPVTIPPIVTPVPTAPTRTVLPRFNQSVTSCDKSTADFRASGVITCGHINWRLNPNSIATLSNDALESLKQYDRVYQVLAEFHSVRPLNDRIIMQEDANSATLTASVSEGVIRLTPSYVKSWLVPSANDVVNRPILMPLLHEIGHMFTLPSQGRYAFMWQSPAVEAYADIGGVLAYIMHAELSGSGEKFAWSAWCSKKKRTEQYCQEFIRTVDEWVSIDHDKYLLDYGTKGSTFWTMFPIPPSSIDVHRRGGPFTSMLISIYRDFRVRGSEAEFYYGLQKVFHTYARTPLLPEWMCDTSGSNRELLIDKGNAFVFLLSISLGMDVSEQYKKWKFPITVPATDYIRAYLKTSEDPKTVLQRFMAGHKTAKSVSTVVGTGTGLTGDYFQDMNFDSRYMRRTDSSISFDWHGASNPIPSRPDFFSVRWTGYIQPRFTEEYTFTTRNDDGVRLWIDGAKIIDDWKSHATVTNSGTIRLEAGKKYPITLEFFDYEFGANIRLYWSSFNQTYQIVPKSALYPAF